jgi:hypothetical protein
MIDRYVFVKLTDAHASATGRAEIAAHTRAALAGVPGVERLTVGTPADEAAVKSWDLSIVVRFRRLEDVEPYQRHPDHRRYVDEYLAPRMQVIKAWNFEVSE